MIAKETTAPGLKFIFFKKKRPPARKWSNSVEYTASPFRISLLITVAFVRSESNNDVFLYFVFVSVADKMRFRLSSLFGSRGNFKPCTPASREPFPETYQVSDSSKLFSSLDLGLVRVISAHV
jgi:hypothetical protein